jgi:hypothetical protein
MDIEATGKILSPLPGIEPRSPGRDWLIVFNKIIVVYSENHTKPIHTKQSTTVKIAGTYSYHKALRG